MPWLPEAVGRRLRPELLPPARETLDGVCVHHPRFLAIPKLLRSSHGACFAWSLRRCLREIRQEFPFELISTHWLYPDAFGTVLAARRSGVPVVVHALGCDVNEYLKAPLRRTMVAWALRTADRIVTKSSELEDGITALGIPAGKVEVAFNGVDREKFKPRDRAAQRERLGLPQAGKIVLFIGNFSIEKGIDHLLSAFARLDRPDAALYLIGGGPLRGEIEARIAQLGLGGRARLPGVVGHDVVPFYLNAADVLCLPSLREGCPNVVLEALASGTPVVASRVGAVPDMAARAAHAHVVPPMDEPALAEALRQALDSNVTPAPFDWPTWEDNAARIAEIFEDAMAERSAGNSLQPIRRPG